MPEEDTEIDRQLDRALTDIEHATMALHLSRSADDRSERMAYARKARDSFDSALAQLNKADNALRASPAWQMWHDETQAGLTAAKKRLAVLGA